MKTAPSLPRRLLLGLTLGLLLSPALPTRAQPGWEEPPGYPSTMTVIASLDLDGTAAADPADLLAAFVGGEVRGVASPLDLGGTLVFFLSIAGDLAGETISFRAYEASTDTERALCENLNFFADALRGSLDSPFTVHAADGASTGTCPLHWNVAEGYGDRMTVYATVAFGERTDAPDDLVAAFAGEAVRGVGVPFDVDGNQVYQIEVWGDITGEVITFRGYESSTAQLHLLNESLVMIDGATHGTPGGPLMLTQAPLPIELASFTARANGADVRLAWTTTSERDNLGFFIEHRPPGALGFTQQGFVHGAGTTSLPHAYSYHLPHLPPGRHAFRLRQIDRDGTTTYSPLATLDLALPDAYLLSPAYPNPFNPQTSFTLSVAQSQPVRVEVLDLLGRRVALLHDAPLAAGAPHRFTVDATGLPSGLYFYRALGAHFITPSRKVVLLR